MDEAEAQLELRRRNICLLADSFADADFIPVIDDVVVSPSVLDAYVARLRTRPMLLVQLVPSLEVVQSRDGSRDKQVFGLWKHLDEELRTSMPPVGLWLDTSRLTPDETVDAIIARWEDAVISEELVAARADARHVDARGEARTCIRSPCGP